MSNTNGPPINAAAHETKKKSNKDLTDEERKAKRDLKNQLKVEAKRARLEVRLRHAVSRKDTALEKTTRHELQAMGVTTTDVVVEQDGNEKMARQFVLEIYRGLKGRHAPKNGGYTAQNKAVQTDQAKALLSHMTKGTQKNDMFDNEDALWGYARLKFQERAMLVYTSFARLRRSEQPKGLTEDESIKRTKAWEALTAVKSICSVGCGPGGDAVGVAAFKKQFSSSDETLSSMLLLDFAMSQWKTILEILQLVMVPCMVKKMDCFECDITKSISNIDSGSSINEAISTATATTQQSIDLYLFSYIITETRGKWETFMRELIETAKPNTLFYYAEPTPWQLFQLRNMFPELEYIWLDSSMNQPVAMQAMDGRLGPGVLLARKP